MGKIVLSTNVTLDGIGQDPTGEEGFAFGGWFNQISDDDREVWAKTFYDEAMATDAILLGAQLRVVRHALGRARRGVG